MKKNLHILITNDDGIDAHGIRYLYNAVKDFAQITVVAPSHEQSAKGLSTTVHSPLKILSSTLFSEHPTYTVSGTPSDCVKMGISVILNKKPDLILSGINRGSNAGKNVLYSGTVGGVIEGTLRSIPGIAFSCCDLDNPDYEQAALYIPRIVDFILENPLPLGTLLNVNFPSKHLGSPYQGFRLARQGKEFWLENPCKREHPFEPHNYYWLGGKLHEEPNDHEDADTHLLKQGFVTAVPVHVNDLTDHAHMKQHQERFKNLFTTNH